MDYRPDFLITPGVIAYDEDIPYAGERLYSIIYWLHGLAKGECVASNSVLAQFMGKATTENYVGRLLKLLEDKGYIRRDFSDEAKMNRERITPLVTYKGVLKTEHPPLETEGTPPPNDTLPPLEKHIQISNMISKSNKYVTSTSKSTPLSRLSKAYKQLYRDTFDMEPHLSLVGKDGAVLKSLLKDYSEYQIVLILIEFFDLKDQKLIDAAFPLSWLPPRLNQLLVSISKDIDINNESEVQREVDQVMNRLVKLSEKG